MSDAITKARECLLEARILLTRSYPSPATEPDTERAVYLIGEALYALEGKGQMPSK